MKKRKTNKQLEKPAIPLTSTLLSKLIMYLLSDLYRDRNFVLKLRTFFNQVNTNIYTEDGDLKPYYDIVRSLEKLVIDEGLKVSDLMIERLIESPKDGEEFQVLLENLFDEEDELDSTTSLYIQNEFVDRLNFINVEPLAQKIKLAISQMENQDYSSYSEIVTKLSELTSSISKTVMSRSASSITLPDFSFNGKEDVMLNTLQVVRNRMNDVSLFIKTGIKRLNIFLNGGWQPGRVYLTNGISGGWKSGLLLNAAIWAVRFNPEVKCYDPQRKPAVLYLSQENDIDETVQRIFAYIGVEYKKEKVESMDGITEKLIKFEIVGGHWDLIIKYRPKGTINTNNIDEIISEIEADGEVEVKFLVHDYIKRLVANQPTGDIRVDLGEVNNIASFIGDDKVKTP